MIAEAGYLRRCRLKLASFDFRVLTAEIVLLRTTIQARPQDIIAFAGNAISGGIFE